MLSHAPSPPKSVRNAVKAICLSIGVTLLLWISNVSVGVMSVDEFASSLGILLLFSILPYKIWQRSNLARQISIALTLFSLLILVFGGYEFLTPLERMVSFIMLPVDLYIIFQLLTKTSAIWFSQR